MEDYIEVNSYSDIEYLESIAQSEMRRLGGSTYCGVVSKHISEISDLDTVTNFHLESSDGSVFQQGGHYVNISRDNKHIYDFTGDQFIGNPDTSAVWIYRQVDSSMPGVFISVNHEEPTDAELEEFLSYDGYVSEAFQEVFGDQEAFMIIL